MNAAARGEVTRFVQFGTLSVAASLGVALLAFAQALALHVWEIATIGIAIALIAGILLSTLTIEIDDQGIFWCFTGGLLSRRVEFTDVARCEPTRWQSMSYGYRMWFNKRAWMITERVRDAVCRRLRRPGGRLRRDRTAHDRADDHVACESTSTSRYRALRKGGPKRTKRW
jgi:hypothetical protein